MTASPIKVFIVDDSRVVRGVMSRMFRAEQDIEVVGAADNGKSALEKLQSQPVDVVILDIEMPVMDGLTALPRILKENPGTRVIMASMLTHRGAEVTVRALSLGASDYVPKPSAAQSSRGLEEIETELKKKIRVLGRRDRVPGSFEIRTPPRRLSGARVRPRVLAIGSSTGGPNALVTLLRHLGPEFPLPILAVQHMPPIFTQKLAERCQLESGIPAGEGGEGDIVVGPRLFVAPGNYHMTVRGNGGEVRIHLDQKEKVHFCRPAVDPLFASVAQAYGPASIGVVLTGMGEDGSAGAVDLVEKGSLVYAQDAESSIVWGMPGAVARAGLASAVLPVEGLAAEIKKALGR